jgi:YggT family protein
MRALYYIVDTLTSLYLGVLILRFVMQLARANFRNPFAEAIVKVTNPLILPLRRILPPMGRIDTASVVAIVLFAIFKVMVLLLFGAVIPAIVGVVLLVLKTLVLAVLWLYVIMIFFYGLAGMLLQGGSSPVYELLAYICEPLLSRVRKIIPSLVAGLDLSFLWAIIALQALIILIDGIQF